MRRVGSPKELGIVLRDRRKQKGLYQADVGELVGIRQATISDFERNASATNVETVFRIAAALGLDIYIRKKSEAPFYTREDDDERW